MSHRLNMLCDHYGIELDHHRADSDSLACAKILLKYIEEGAEPGQFKAFIDRCTPWCNTHDPHAAIKPGKKGYVIALRTGPNMPECERIIGSIEHFYGHLEINCMGHIGLTSIEYKTDVESRKQEIIDFCKRI